MKEKRLCFIIPYFGKLPNYFPVFLKTCKANPSYNWLVFTDDNNDYGYPQNVKRIKMTFEECKNLIISKFSCPINITKPYKLCDLKPMYGYIFEEYIKNYRFWGHCDVDTIMGNLSKWLTDEFLEKYDKIFQLGHMTIYRNTEINNRVFMNEFKGEYPYKSVLKNDQIMWFDEEWNNPANINRIFIAYRKNLFKKDLSFNISYSYNHFIRGTFVGVEHTTFPYGYEIEEKKKQKEQEINQIIEKNKDKLVSAIRRIESAYSNFDVRKLSAVTKDSGVTFQVLCGWMTSKEAKKLLKETDNDVNVVCIISDDVEDHKTTPPTKLKNFKFAKPFELFVRMYGLPGYNEFDPTLFLTITYALIFGVMFGDLGQGLCLVIGGGILYKVKKMDLAGIVCAAGVFSCIFGALFGSFFGFEFESVIKPLDSMTTLPFLGEINIVLVAAFLFGSFIILTTMILNIATAIKQKNLGKALFGPNAVTGFIFYGSVILVILLYMTGHPLPGTALLVVMFVIPLILIFLEEPLKNILAKKKPIDDSPGIFAATAFFELFDYLITYLSNALSFLRIGVFAISHAAMMQVVMTLAGAENGGSANIFVVIIGNIIVLAMEGLVVGIQVLRLEYYEIFGRFYEGNGREFVPYRKRNKK